MMHYKLVCIVLVIIFCYMPYTHVVVVEAAASSFSVELIHRDSPKSPFYNHSLTSSDILRRAALRSHSRLQHLQYSINSGIKALQYYSTIFPSNDGGEYLMKIYMGTNPVPLPFYAIADTGSDLTWLQCGSCRGCFNPPNSSTYHRLLCNSPFCKQLPTYGCNKAKRCAYTYKYGDGSLTQGVLSTDTISLDSTTGRRPMGFPASVFGCSYHRKGNLFGGSGLVGLGGGPLSLVSQLGARIGYKFSYCLVPYWSKSSSKLRFGEDAVLRGPNVVSTPLIIRKNTPTYYFLTLQRIGIGTRTTQTLQTKGNIIIDSGTTLTYLDSSLYEELKSIVRLQIGAKPVQDPSGTFNLCYRRNSVASFPYMRFYFTGIYLQLPPDHTFVRYDKYNLICMAIMPSNNNGLSIFGNIAQVNFQVEYDLHKSRISFGAADCSKR